MTLRALEALGADPATTLLVVIGKPPAPEVRERVEALARGLGKPVVLALLGREMPLGQRGPVVAVATLEDAALAALAGLERKTWTPPPPFSIPAAEARRRVRAARRGLRPGQAAIRGLYAGGTLAHEAMLILERLLGPVASNLDRSRTGAHRVTDLGTDEFTRGRAHPMLDPTARIAAVREAAGEDEVAVLLLDVVLGSGAAGDPAGDIAPALEAARAGARARGRALAVVASVVGTEADPQGLDSQVARLGAAGAWVLPSNAQAARAAACIAGGDPVMRGLLETGAR
jgi:FdrA protein